MALQTARLTQPGMSVLKTTALQQVRLSQLGATVKKMTDIIIGKNADREECADKLEKLFDWARDEATSVLNDEDEI